MAPTPDNSVCAQMQPKSICEDGGSLYCDGFVDARPATGTCTAYCQIKGLKCTDAWDDDEMNGRHGCPKNLEEHNDCDTKLGTQICRCAPAAQAPTPQPTTPPPTAVPPGYDYHPQACVLGSNVEQLHDMASPAECAAKCDAATFGCIGFEFFHNYNGDTDLYKAGDCNLQDSVDMTGCSGLYWNMDFYSKRTKAPTNKPTQRGFTHFPTRGPTAYPTQPPTDRKCAEGWTLEPLMQQRCYKAVPAPTDSKTWFSWETAQEQCRKEHPALGSDLATIMNPIENDFVKDKIVQSVADREHIHLWYFGCNDINTPVAVSRNT